MFALIDWRSYEEVYKAFPKEFDTNAERISYYRKLRPGTKTELKEKKPKLVTFLDLKNIKSINPIYYGKMNEVLGSGVRLKSITIEMTRDPVTIGVVDKNLPKTYQREIKDRWMQFSNKEVQRLYKITRFKQ